MRKIEERIIGHLTMFADSQNTVHAGEDVSATWGHDSVTLYESGLIVYRLHGNTVARYAPHEKTLELGLINWQTVTTKSRINAIARAFGLPRVYQKNFRWYWSDGEEYHGARMFFLDR